MKNSYAEDPMSLELQSRLAGYAVYLPAALMAIASMWAIAALRRPPRAERPDRGTAITMAIGLGLLAGGGFAVFVAMLGAAWGGSATAGIPVGVLLGGGVALAIVLSGLVGYAVAARPGIGALAVAGVLAGPLVLGGTTALAVQVKNIADYAYSYSLHGPEAQAARAREVERLRALLTITVTEVRVETFLDRRPDGTVRELVQGVSLTLVVTSDEAITLGDGQRVPHAWFFPDAAGASGFDVPVPIAAPYQLPAGESTFVIKDRWPERGPLVTWPDAPQPGPWTLRFIFYPPSVPDGAYEVVTFEVPGG